MCINSNDNINNIINDINSNNMCVLLMCVMY